MSIPIADMRVRSDTGVYIGPTANFTSGTFKIDGAALMKKGVTIASGTTTNIGAADGDFVDVSGTATITGLGTIAAGARREVRFTGAATLTHNATSLILPTGANIVTANGDCAVFRSLGTGNWFCTKFMRADGSALSSAGTTVAASISTGQNNYSPTGYAASTTTLLLTCGTGASLTGLQGGVADRLVTIYSSAQSPDYVSFVSNSSLSLGDNRFDFSLQMKPGTAVRLRYNGDTDLWNIEQLGEVIVSGNYGLSTFAAGEMHITNDGGGPALDFNWEDGLQLVVPMSVGSLLYVAADGSLAVPLCNFSDTASTITGNRDNYVGSGVDTYLNRLSSSATWNITGHARPSGSGTGFASTYRDVNVGSHDIVYQHQNTSSTDYNRFICPFGTALVMKPGDIVMRTYDPTTARWRVNKFPAFDQSLNNGESVVFDTLTASDISCADISGSSGGFNLTTDGIGSSVKIGCDNDPTAAATYMTSTEGFVTDIKFLGPSFKLSSTSALTTPATTGTIALTTSGELSRVINTTPTGNQTFNADANGKPGAQMTFIVTTSGTSSFTMTFGTNFKSTGTLATGTVTAKVFTVSFICGASGLWVEKCRTVAM